MHGSKPLVRSTRSVRFFALLLALVATILAAPSSALAANGDQLTTIANPANTTIEVFDYWVYNANGQSVGPDNKYGINQVGVSGVEGTNPSLWFWSNTSNNNHGAENKWTGAGGGAYQGLVSRTLDANGYPVLTFGNQESLSYLFDSNDINVTVNGQTLPAKRAYSGDQLLTVDGDGNYFFDSKIHKGKLNTTEPNPNTGKCDFTVTEQSNGEFYPFSDTSPDKFFFGVHVKSEFSIPEDGIVINPSGEEKEMVFDFTGDDDVWVYIDGVLIGDVGGIHDTEELSINFATGKVSVWNPDNDTAANRHDTTIKAMAEAAGAADKFTWNGDTIASGYHTMDFFYLERGAGKSNMKLSYNLVSTYDFTAHKALYKTGGEDEQTLAENQFRYRLTGYACDYDDPETGTTRKLEAVMPKVQPDEDIYWNAAYGHDPGIELDTEPADNPKVLEVGVSADGNVNFGNALLEGSPTDETCELYKYNGKTFKYVIEELPPEGAVLNDDGTYTYKGKTISPNADGSYTFDSITYDKTKFYFTGTISPEGWVNKTYYTDDTYTTVATGVNFADFRNYYSSTGKTQLMATKKYVDGYGNTLTQKKDQFSFKVTQVDATGATVVDGDGNPVFVQTATNAADGSVTFDTIKYDQSDLPGSATTNTYYYKVEEVPGSDADITYATDVYYAKVSLTDNGSGEINVVTKYYKDAACTSEIAQQSVVFTNTNSKTTVKAKKVWNDDNNRDGLRADVTLQLMQSVNGATATVVEGQETKTIAATASGGALTVTWSDLPILDGNGNIITYSVKETTVPTGYSVSYSKPTVSNGVTNYTVTNKHTPVRVSVKVTKVWCDNGNADSVRPVSVDVTLMNGETAVSQSGITATQTLNADSSWTYTWKNLYKFASGEAITYTVAELAVEGYGVTISEDIDASANFEYTVTNARTTLDTETNPVLKKSVEAAGTAWGPKTFTFTIAAGTATYSDSTTGTSPLAKDDQGADITTGTATFSEAGTKVIDFGTIVYTKAGTYTYTVNENTPWAGSGWQYDNRPKTVTVTVTEGEDGNLTATVTPVTITNKYNATGSVTFAGTKTIQNKPASMDYDGFVFTIHEVKEGQRPATIGTGKCHANTGNTIVFHTPTIGYTLKDVGTHTYTITEDAVLDGGKPMKPGVSIDSRTYTVTVKVEDNGDGTLKVTTLSGTPGKLDFVNVYAASGSATISASKELVGRAWKEGESYTFTLYEGETALGTRTVDADESVSFDAIGYTQADMVDASGAYAAEVTKTYTIKESGDLAANGLTPSGDVTATVTLTDDGQGHISTSVAYSGGAGDAKNRITNTYEATGTLDLSGKKKLEGGTLEADAFGFKVTEVADAEGTALAGAYTETVYNKGDGTFAFATITYTKNAQKNDEGTHYYKVEELVPDQTGSITYVTAPYIVTVKVTDAGDGTLSVSPSSNYNALNFVNTIEKVSVSVTKVWDDQDDADGKRPENLQVQLYANGTASGDPVTLSEGSWSHTWSGLDKNLNDKAITYTVDEVAVPAGYAKTVSADTDESESFAYTITNTHVPNEKHAFTTSVEQRVDGELVTAGQELGYEIAYANNTNATGDVTVKDTIPANTTYVDGSAGTGVYDAATRTITWTIPGVVAGASGTVTFKVTVDDAAAGTTLKNDATVIDGGNESGYKTNPVENPVKHGDVTLAASKELAGRAWHDGESYTFTLSAGTNTAEGGVATPLPAAGGETVTFSADGALSFGKIDFTRPGTYRYTIAETSELPGGVAKSDDIEVVVTVTENDTQVFDVVATYTPENATIVNTYTAEGAQDVNASKTVQFFDLAKLYDEDVAAGMFKFSLVAVDAEGNPLEGDAAYSETVANDAEGKVAFSAIKYTLDDLGAHYYQLREIAGTASYITYDTTVYTVAVEVGDHGDGTLDTALSIVDADGNAVDEAAFENVYNASNKVQLTALKKLTGIELEEGQFSFELRDADGNVLQTKTNDATGSVTFDELSFDVSTIPDSAWTYAAGDDAAESNAATDDGSETGDQAAGSDEADTGEGAGSADNANAGDTAADSVAADSSDADTGSSEAPVSDALADDGAATSEAEADTDSADGNDVEVSAAAARKSGGLFPLLRSFFGFQTALAAEDDALVTDAGSAKRTATFTYTIAEVNGGAAGYTYDEHLETVTVTVEDDGQGNLTVTATYDEDGAEFVNTFVYEPVSVDPPVSKTVTGDTPEVAGTFQFTMTADAAASTLPADMSELPMPEDSDGQTKTITGAGAGTYEFGEITFTEPGTYVYTFSEVKVGERGYTYDGSVYTVTHVVTAEGNVLSAETTITKDGEPADAVVFENVYRKDVPGLAVDKTTTSAPADGKAYLAGETIAYKIVVTNTGNIDLANVAVVDPLTGDAWTVAELATGASQEFTTSHVVSEAEAKAGTVVNTVTADAENPVDPSSPLHDDDAVEDPTQVKSTPPVPPIVPHTSDIKLPFMLFAGAGAVVLVIGIVMKMMKRK